MNEILEKQGNNMKDEKVKNLLNQVKQIVKTHKEHANKQGENFNIFSILRMERREVKTHSNFIYELLNPQGSHGQGDIFLKSFAKIVLDSEFSDSAIDPQREDLTDENRRIDFTLKTDKNIIGIEMKIDAGDQKNQLFDYQNALDGKKGVKGTKLFYLTLDGSEASKYSYKKDGKAVEYNRISFKEHILNWIDDCIAQSAEKSVLREALIQYKILIEKLTGQDKDMNTEIANLIGKNTENFKSALELEKGLIQAKTQFQIDFWKELQTKLGKNYEFGAESTEISNIDDICKEYYQKNKYARHGIVYNFANSNSRLMLIVNWGVYFCIKNGDGDVNTTLRGKNKENISTDSNGWFYPKIHPKIDLDFRRFKNDLIDVLNKDNRDETITALANEFKGLVEKIENTQ